MIVLLQKTAATGEKPTSLGDPRSSYVSFEIEFHDLRYPAFVAVDRRRDDPNWSCNANISMQK